MLFAPPTSNFGSVGGDPAPLRMQAGNLSLPQFFRGPRGASYVSDQHVYFGFLEEVNLLPDPTPPVPQETMCFPRSPSHPPQKPLGAEPMGFPARLPAATPASVPERLDMPIPLSVSCCVSGPVAHVPLVSQTSHEDSQVNQEATVSPAPCLPQDSPDVLLQEPFPPTGQQPQLNPAWVTPAFPTLWRLLRDMPTLTGGALLSRQHPVSQMRCQDPERAGWKQGHGASGPQDGLLRSTPEEQGA